MTPAQTAAVDQFAAIADADLDQHIAALKGDLTRRDRAHTMVAVKGLLKILPQTELETLLAAALVRLAEIEA
jgi:hypothetical protein